MKTFNLMISVIMATFFATFVYAAEISTASQRASTTHPKDWLDTQTPVQWLSEKNFEKLENHLDALYKEFQKNPEREYRLIWSYLAISNSESNAPLITQWATARPESYQAAIALAGLANNKAANIRRGRTADKISREDFSSMDERYDEAHEVLKKVLVLRPDHPVADYFFIGSCRSGSRNCRADEALFIEKNAPHAYFARRALLNFMQPKWGGSMEMIASYQKTIQKGLKTNPHWAPLLVYDQHALCDTARWNNEYEKAMSFCRKAWSQGPDMLYLSSMSWLAGKLGLFKEFREYTDQLKARFPSKFSQIVFVKIGGKARFPSNFYEDDLRKFAKEMVQWGRWLASKDSPAAMEAFTEAQKVSPDFADAYLERARLFYKQKNFPSAEKDFNKAILIDPDDLFALEWLTFLLDQQKRAQEMIPQWKSYIERHPDESKAYFEIAKGYFSQRNIKATYESVKKACALGHEKSCAWEERLKPHRQLQ